MKRYAEIGWSIPLSLINACDGLYFKVMFVWSMNSNNEHYLTVSSELESLGVFTILISGHSSTLVCIYVSFMFITSQQCHLILPWWDDKLPLNQS